MSRMAGFEGPSQDLVTRFGEMGPLPSFSPDHYNLPSTPLAGGAQVTPSMNPSVQAAIMNGRPGMAPMRPVPSHGPNPGRGGVLNGRMPSGMTPMASHGAPPALAGTGVGVGPRPAALAGTGAPPPQQNRPSMIPGAGGAMAQPRPPVNTAGASGSWNPRAIMGTGGPIDLEGGMGSTLFNQMRAPQPQVNTISEFSMINMMAPDGSMVPVPSSMLQQMLNMGWRLQQPSYRPTMPVPGMTGQGWPSIIPSGGAQ
jgi:hypothetical protein